MKPGVLIAVVCVFAAACVSNLDRGVQHFANQEYDMAAKYWNPLAKNGNPHAQYNLGLLWESGLGSTPKDSEQAILWYLKSARQGFPLAMVRAADLQYQLGYEEAALSWFTLAARWGNDDAVGALRKLGKPVPQADLLQAQIAREQREAEEEGDALAGPIAIGAILGGSNNAGSGSSVYTPLPTDSSGGSVTSTNDGTCTSDYSCGIGFRCVKKPYSSKGVCLKSVDEYGTPTFNLPDGNSLGVNTEKSCEFDVDCPVGFKCDPELKACVK